MILFALFLYLLIAVGFLTVALEGRPLPAALVLSISWPCGIGQELARRWLAKQIVTAKEVERFI